MNLKFSSKSGTLQNLSKFISSAEVLPMVKFSASEYLSNKNIYLKECINKFDCNVIVRSSSINEDNNKISNAGEFETIQDVFLEYNKLDNAIQRVINSYGEHISKKDEVFIQPMLKNVSMSGVIFTSDIDTLAPYYIINYDESGSTNSVTGGTKADLKTLVIFKNATTFKDIKMTMLLKACKECENIFDNNFIDIEFAFSENRLFILQVRPIVQNNKDNLSHINLESSLEKLQRKIRKLNTPHPKLLGSKTIFGLMPDWNPAEIIGTKPKRLAISLYKELITDEIWAYQRDNYGYRNLRSFPLLVSFLGVPYIDVRISFNSFIPKKLHDSIASKLVEYYLDELSENSNHHDKIEFEIVYSCYYFGINKKLEKLKKKGFSSNEIKRVEFELLELTNKVIDIENGLYKKDLQKIEQLHNKYEEILNSQLSTIDKIYWLIEDCKRYGTLPFAGIARAAFIAIQFVNSFVEEGIFTQKDKELFLNSLNTISKKLSYDKNCLSKEEFIKIYGHLRPGTYDITSKRYDEAYSEYFEQTSCKVSKEEFIFTKEQKNLIEKLIIENGLNTNFNNLIKFIKDSIEGREYSKFVFTKHLSKILLLIEEFGNKLDITRDDLAYLDIQKIKNLYATLDHREVKDIFEFDIQKNKDYYEYTKAVKLPSLITQENDIYFYYLKKEEANFITLRSITGHIIDIDNREEKIYKNKIVCIKSADPGYDYLFSKNIGGLITCYGGANSHMAIRCAELNIPAVIGCGENLFEEYKKSNIVEIDASNKQVKIIS